MKLEKYLPIGTVVLLKEAKKRIMIIGYLPVSKDDTEKVYDYAACLYPEGIISSDKTLLFNHDQIEEIYFLGSNDGEASDFLNQIKNVDRDEVLKELEKESEQKIEDSNSEKQETIKFDE